MTSTTIKSPAVTVKVRHPSASKGWSIRSPGSDGEPRSGRGDPTPRTSRDGWRSGERVAGVVARTGNGPYPRYTEGVANPFVQSMASNFERALRMMEEALADCPDELWEVDLWPDEAPTAATPHGGLHGSAPWFLGYHALLTLDYDLIAEFEPWAPPEPFDENTYAYPNRVFSKDELIGYIDYGRERVRRTLDGLTEEAAARPVPSAHRYRGTPYGVIVGGMPLHVVEHASQIRQFVTAAGVRPGRARSGPTTA